MSYRRFLNHLFLHNLGDQYENPKQIKNRWPGLKYDTMHVVIWKSYDRVYEKVKHLNLFRCYSSGANEIQPNEIPL